MSMRDPRQHRPPTGFTLLELMIAILLMAVLLTATWSLLGIYRNQFERNQQRTERSQLMRSLRQRLEEDLRSSLLSGTDGSDQEPAGGPSPASADQDASAAAEVELPSQGALEPAIGLARPIGLEPIDPLTDPAETAGPDLAAEISQQLWLSPAVGLRGNAQGLVVDVLKPLEPPTVSITVPTNDQQVEIPDIVRRVVYVFVDKPTAQRQGRPAGLLRCEWTDRELLLLRSAAGQSDLFDLLRNLVPDWPEVETDQRMSKFGLAPTTPRLADLGPQLQTGLDQLKRQVSQRVDLLPEITAFRLRYFDGGGWQDRWDSRQKKSLPVAVELRFEVAPLEPPEAEANEIDPVTGEPLEPEESLLTEQEPTEAPVEPLDPRLMSAQSQMMQQQDERLVLFLHPPTGPPPPAESTEEDSFGFSAGFDEGPP
jgi:prepilin-type N-terminal cleavage/methylation domain-containing protein